MDHRKARAELAKLPPDTLRAITIRLPAAILIAVHRWAEERGLDLTSAIRDLTALGQEAAARPDGQDSAAIRSTVKKWRGPVVRALRAGQSPLQPLLGHEISETDLEAVRRIVVEADYRSLVQQLNAKLEEGSPAERAWKVLQAEAPDQLRKPMAALDRLGEKFLARKKLYYQPGEEGDTPVVHWLFADAVTRELEKASSDNKDVEAVRQLIAARYLVAENPEGRPWEFVWDD
jgi:hypothetical protein